MKTLILLLPLLLAVQANAIVWTATLPDGGGVGTVTLTSWGAIVSYSDYPSAVSTSISGRTTYTTTTRTADAPLTLSLMSSENWNWVNALNNHWVSFSAAGIDGTIREAEFYPNVHTGDVTKAMYSAVGDSHVQVPELSVTSTLTAVGCFFLAILKLKNKLR